MSLETHWIETKKTIEEPLLECQNVPVSLLCIRCDENEIEGLSPYCEECWDYHKNDDSWWRGFVRNAEYAEALAAARAAHPDFDQLEPAWGL